MDLRGRRRREIQTKIETHHKQVSSVSPIITPQEKERQEQEREERIAMMARVAAEFKAEWDKNEAVWRAEAMAMRERIEAGEDPEYVRNYSDLAAQAAEFRDTWNEMYSPYFGCFEETSSFSIDLMLEYIL
ncbi:hypothetical protein U9M48_010407 [Paspalum notatum var. saurae]|uniref:Uncharacterized protein n=1 Tax=Paspalum notatum var. saurae TaxID=547442 RepID=A0AAQ3WG80_PASNO